MAVLHLWHGGLDHPDRSNGNRTTDKLGFFPHTIDATMYGYDGVLIGSVIPQKLQREQVALRAAAVGDIHYLALVPHRRVLERLHLTTVPNLYGRGFVGINHISNQPVGLPNAQGATIRLVANRFTYPYVNDTPLGAVATAGTVLSTDVMGETDPTAELAAPVNIPSNEVVLVGYEIMSLPTNTDILPDGSPFSWYHITDQISVYAQSTPFFDELSKGNTADTINIGGVLTQGCCGPKNVL